MDESPNEWNKSSFNSSYLSNCVSVCLVLRCWFTTHSVPMTSFHCARLYPDLSLRAEAMKKNSKTGEGQISMETNCFSQRQTLDRTLSCGCDVALLSRVPLILWMEEHAAWRLMGGAGRCWVGGIKGNNVDSLSKVPLKRREHDRVRCSWQCSDGTHISFREAIFSPAFLSSWHGRLSSLHRHKSAKQKWQSTD